MSITTQDSEFHIQFVLYYPQREDSILWAFKILYKLLTLLTE